MLTPSQKSSALDDNPPTAQPDGLSSPRMLQPNFDPAPTEVRIHRCGYVSRSKARGGPKRATLIPEKTDAAGRHVRQIELCRLHCEIVIKRERARGLEIF